MIFLARIALIWYIPLDLEFILFGRRSDVKYGCRFMQGWLAAGCVAFSGGVLHSLLPQTAAPKCWIPLPSFLQGRHIV